MPQATAEPVGKPQKISVLVADSSRMSSQLLAEALAQESEFEVAGIEAASASLKESLGARRPHVLLLSSTVNGAAGAGFEMAREVHSVSPATRIIMLIDEAGAAAVIEAFRSGAQGVFSRNESSKALAKCIRSVHQGQVWANSSELRFLLQALREAPQIKMVDANGDTILSKREHDVVHCVAEGLSNREIAKKLKLTEHTVKNYLFRIFDKLGVSSRVEVVLYAFSSLEAGHSSHHRNGVTGSEDRDPNPDAGPTPSKSPSPGKELARRARI